MLVKTNIIFTFGLVFILFWKIKEVEGGKNYTIKPRVVLPDNYVKEIRPPSKKGSPVIVDLSIFVVDINSINVEDMDFRVDMFVHQRWIENRLKLPDDIFEEGDDYVTLPPEFFDNLWQPDPYFLNSKIAEIATLTHKFTSVTLYKNKTVRYAARMHAIIACQMEFQMYPMDIQICPIQIESFSYNNQKVKLKWSDTGVILNPELKLLQYNLGQPLQLQETDGYMPEKVGNFSRLTVFFRFERQIGHHLIQTFAPSSLVVMLSWFSFWLGLDAIPGRVTLLVTCMLTLVTMFTGLRADIPPVAYVKALDLWMAGCMMFVFAALGEFVVVKVLDVQYQLNKISKVIPPRMTAMEKGQCPSVVNWEGGAVRARKGPPQTPTTPGQVEYPPTAIIRQLRMVVKSAGIEFQDGDDFDELKRLLIKYDKQRSNKAIKAQQQNLPRHKKTENKESDVNLAILRCYNCSGQGHFSDECSKIKREISSCSKCNTKDNQIMNFQKKNSIGNVNEAEENEEIDLVEITSLQGNGGPPKPGRRQSILSVSWKDDTGVEKIMWREIDKKSRIIFPSLFLLFVVFYWPILLLKSK